MNFQLTDEFLASQGLSKTLPQRFWQKVNKRGPIPEHVPELGECWVWTGYARNRDGYGGIYGGRKHRQISAHRVAWILANGAIPVAMKLLHKCDNSACCRADHLYLGGDAENVSDRETRERSNRRQGESHGMAKLNWKLVKEIRERHIAEIDVSHQVFAKEYGVEPATIGQIVRNKIWRDPDYKPVPDRRRKLKELREPIRAIYIRGVTSQVSIAERFGVSQALVSAAVRGV